MLSRLPGVPAVHGVCWFIEASPHLCHHCHMASPCVRVCAQMSPFIGHHSYWIRPTLLQCDFTLNNYTCSDPTSKCLSPIRLL